MGYAHVIWVYEDGLRRAAGRETEVGQAILNACEQHGSAAVSGHANCVNFCDDVHSTDARLYLWKGNCLRPLHRLEAADLRVAARVLADQRANREAALNQTGEISSPDGESVEEPGELSGIGCPNCYNFLPWDGAVDTIRCRCGRVLRAADLARRLLTAFSAPSLRHNPAGILAHDVLRHTAQYGWGDGLHIGRRDWIELGMPLTDSEFAAVVSRGGAIQLSSCARLFQSFESREELPETGAAIARRVQAEGDALCRESLYRLAEAPQVTHESLLAALRAAMEREETGSIAWECCERAIRLKEGSQQP